MKLKKRDVVSFTIKEELFGDQMKQVARDVVLIQEGPPSNGSTPLNSPPKKATTSSSTSRSKGKKEKWESRGSNNSRNSSRGPTPSNGRFIHVSSSNSISDMSVTSVLSPTSDPTTPFFSYPVSTPSSSVSSPTTASLPSNGSSPASKFSDDKMDVESGPESTTSSACSSPKKDLNPLAQSFTLFTESNRHQDRMAEKQKEKVRSYVSKGPTSGSRGFASKRLVEK